MSEPTAASETQVLFGGLRRPSHGSIGACPDVSEPAAVRFDEPINADSPIALRKHFARLTLATTRRTGYRVAEPISAQRRLPTSMRSSMIIMVLSVCLALLGTSCGGPLMATKADSVAHLPNPMLNENYPEDAEIPFSIEPKTAMAHGSRQVSFDPESASRRTRDMADWVVSSKDNLNMPFAIVDKINAKVYVFGADGRLKGAAPVLLGLAQGDFSAPGVGSMRLSRIPPAQRTTPAGRFVATMGRNSHGKEILWLDYENAISMHPVITSNPKERRAQRLATPSPLDNRISFGCINVPVEFFSNVVDSMFSGTGGIIYVLPETKRIKLS